MEKKHLIIALLTFIMLTTTTIPLTLSVGVGQYETTWHDVIEGNLDEPFEDGQPYDMDLYPFENDAVNWGFSKYGELIGIRPGDDPDVQSNWVGLEYNGVRDPFAPASDIPMTSWFNGWFIDIEYTGGAVVSPRDRHVWAYALFADGDAWGYDWQFATTPSGAPHGGRKTNAYAVTEDYKVLYHGPREFIVQMTTHLYDTNTPGVQGWPLCDVVLTIIFNKIKKEIVILKDIKLTIDKGRYVGKIDVQFSNREEYDLGPAPGYTSYAYFYEQEGSTCFYSDWHLAENLTRHREETRTAQQLTDVDMDGVREALTLNVPGPYNYVAPGFMMVWVDDTPFGDPVFMTQPEDYSWNGATNTISFVNPPTVNSTKIIIHYKYVFKTPSDPELPDWDHKYDIAQIISSDEKYVAWAAFWPPVSDYTVDGFGILLSPLVEIQVPDIISTTEPMQSPMLIGEWDFLMDREDIPQYRCVEVKGISDLNDGEDDDMGIDHYNVIDREALYQLDEIFNPWDINDAVHKKQRRWVDYYEVTATDVSQADLGYSLVIPLPMTPVHYASVWEQYCNNAENVLWDVAEMPYYLKTPQRALATAYNYIFSVDSLGVGRVTIPSTKVPAAGTLIKTLYSTDTEVTVPAKTISMGPLVYNASLLSFPFNVDLDSYLASSTTESLWTDLLNVDHDIDVQDFEVTIDVNASLLNDNATWTYTLGADANEWEFAPFKLFHGETMENEWQTDDWDNQTVTNNGIVMDLKMEDLDVDYDITGPTDPLYKANHIYTVHFNYMDADIYYAFTVTYNNVTNTLNITAYVTVGDSPYLYEASIGGAYEWLIVGRDSAAVDSAGASMVSEYFDSQKQIPVTQSGLDVQDDEFGPEIPFVFQQLRPSLLPAKDGYRNGTWGGNTGRAKLKDMWSCHEYLGSWVNGYPIESSNIIGVGGMEVNLLTEYTNDFTMVKFDRVNYEIVPYTCWSIIGYGDPSLERVYEPVYVEGEQTVGYGVIQVYKDIDGTKFFNVWGYTGQDTYYTAWSMWNTYLGEKLQTEPLCLTDLIIEFDYSKHPTDPCFWEVVEAVGTISEFNFEEVLKQPPIHPDP